MNEWHFFSELATRGDHLEASEAEASCWPQRRDVQVFLLTEVGRPSGPAGRIVNQI